MRFRDCRHIGDGCWCGAKGDPSEARSYYGRIILIAHRWEYNQQYIGDGNDRLDCQYRD